MLYRTQRACGLAIAAALLAACAGVPTSLAPTTIPTALPTAAPATAPVATRAPAPTSAPATAVPATEPPIAAATETPAPTAVAQPEATMQPLATAAGQVVLQLGAGAGPDQIGINVDGANVVGPRSFRIGADGSIRLLDNVNKRVLFFDPSGKVTRTLRLDDAQEPIDFIVNNAGEVFVYGGDGGPNFQVLRYGPDGAVTARLPVSPGISADGIMLTAAQDLMLVQGNQTYWTLLHQGVTVDPKIQPLTLQEGAVTPRSPTIFRTIPGQNGTLDLRVIGLNGGVSGENVMEVGSVTTSLPADARFFNVDRAMSLYFTRPSAEGNAVDVWRVLPDGSIAGGAHIETGACGTSWRNFYVDQAGAAWTMCVNGQGATVTHFTLQDQNGQPLPEAAKEAADVAWKPGAQLTAA
ncbi:MAG TPA: hypothetical protein VKE41_06325 [Roseiflexaceae bacterium]|nr:hypothetical protein [Roseiflexaceae bacterium]